MVRYPFRLLRVGGASKRCDDGDGSSRTGEKEGGHPVIARVAVIGDGGHILQRIHSVWPVHKDPVRIIDNVGTLTDVTDQPLITKQCGCKHRKRRLLVAHLFVIKTCDIIEFETLSLVMLLSDEVMDNRTWVNRQWENILNQILRGGEIICA